MFARIVAAMAALTAVFVLWGCSPSGESAGFKGIDLADSGLGRDFALTGTDGHPRTLADFKGKAVLVFFGFTQCPDICPTALARAAEVKRLLGEQGERLQVVFITVDPERDTPEILDAYTQAFDPSFVGLYGTLEQTAQTARDFKVFYQKVPTGSSYTMDHTALSYLYDPGGRLRLAMRHTQTAEEYAGDIRKLLSAGA